MVFNIKYLFCLSILLSLFKPRVHAEMITATTEKKPLLEINKRIIDVDDYEEKSLEALQSHLMTAEECYSLCKAFYSKIDLENTLVWSMETLRKYKEETTEEHSFTEVDVLEYIAYVHYLMGDIKKALEWTKKLLKLDPKHPRAAGNVPQYQDIIARQESASQYQGKTGDETEDEKEKAIKMSEEMHEFNVAQIHLLTAADCFELSKVFYDKKDYNYSLVWSMETLRKYKEETTEEHSFTEVDVLDYIAFTHYLMGDVKAALEWTKKMLKLDPNHLRAAGNVPRYEEIIARGDEKGNFNKLSEEMHQFDVAKSLQMTAANCFELGKALYHKNDYNNSLAWNMESLRKFKNEATDEHSFTEVDVLEYIAFTHYLMGDTKTALEWTKKLLKLDPYHPRAVANVPYFEKAITDKLAATKKGDTGDEDMPKFDVAKSRQVTAQRCFNLCQDFFFKNDFNNSVAWGMEALRKYREETDKVHTFSEVDVMEYIAFSHNMMDDLESALEWTKKLLKLDPNHPRAAKNLPLFEEALAEEEAGTKKHGDTGDEFEDETNGDESRCLNSMLLSSVEMPKFDVAKSHLMTAAACFKLCKDFYFKNDFKNSLVWSMETLRKYKEETNKEHSFTEVDVLEYIGLSHFMMGDFKTALEWTQQLLKLDPNHARAVGHVPLFEKAIAGQKSANKKRLGTGVPTEDKKHETDDETDDEKAKPDQIISDVASPSPTYAETKLTYEALCRGEMEINSDVAKRLFCRYMSETHPFLRLAPIKAEQLFIDPNVFLFHGVLSDDEIQVIKVMSTPRLKRATVSSATTVGATMVVSYRISKSTWLSDKDSDEVARVSQRVADMTGLSVESAEELQVVNYGIGGHYEPHCDFAPKDKLPFKLQDGNRIATVLFYMSDVVQGGATVFTKLGLSVFPERGAALFFINLHASGEGDTATHHGACPVLRGSKWVCNKWIHEGGQELAKPCNRDCRREETTRKIPSAARAPILPQ